MRHPSNPGEMYDARRQPFVSRLLCLTVEGSFWLNIGYGSGEYHLPPAWSVDASWAPLGGATES